MKQIDIKKLKPNPDNPRVIRDDKFTKLVQSLKDFPEMTSVRPIVANTELVVLGGNMRLKAMQEAGWDKVPVEVVDWPEDKQREFIIKDNASFGEWDWAQLDSGWDNQQLEGWGLDVWQTEGEVDYSILDDDDDIDQQLDEMAGGVKKAIQIEFEPDHYEEAFELVKYWRERDAYVGKMILDFLKAEKGKL